MQIIRGKIESAQKVCVYGPEGIGKSTFAAQFPNALFIDTEGSTKHMDVARLPFPSSWTMLLNQVEYIKKNAETCQTLIIDTADWAEQLCSEHICANAKKDGIEEFGYGKGYVYLAEEFARLLHSLNELIELGINIVITAHAQMRKFEQPDEMGSYDRWEMKLQKKTAPLVKEWADTVLFANYKTYVIKEDEKKEKGKAQGGKRVMYTTHHPCWDAKNRYDLPDELPFDYSAIAHCIPTKPISQSKSKPITPEPASEPTPISELQSNELSDLPKALADLMQINGVSVFEIQQVVANRGYYPADTPITNYDRGFIDGVLVGAWDQVFDMIKTIRDESAPF
jgi:GTPase SAR1 family protein